MKCETILMDAETWEWWKELEEHEKDRWCCSTLKEGAFEEYLKLEFSSVLPIRFSVNYCCQCGNPIKHGYERNEDGREDWCCRLMHAIGFEWIEFKKADSEISTLRVNYCFHCGRRLGSNWQVKVHNDCDDCGECGSSH